MCDFDIKMCSSIFIFCIKPRTFIFIVVFFKKKSSKKTNFYYNFLITRPISNFLPPISSLQPHASFPLIYLITNSAYFGPKIAENRSTTPPFSWPIRAFSNENGRKFSEKCAEYSVPGENGCDLVEFCAVLGVF
jgi:hypothetical protein